MVREEKPEAELELSSVVYILNSWGPYIVERRSTVAIEKKSVNCWVAETKLTLTSLEGWIGVSWALLPDPYLRSPASRVTRDFPMQLHPALYCTTLHIHSRLCRSVAVQQWRSWQGIFQLDSRAGVLLFSGAAQLQRQLTHCGEAWGQRNGGEEVRDSPH